MSSAIKPPSHVGQAWLEFAESSALAKLRGDFAKTLAQIAEEAFVAGYRAGLEAGGKRPADS